ncbi:hypothetical protein L3X38_012533 [Prunus dulcis]|uniref:Uncharacterized protein n=1 Tax=Prunus dulcis TaxID=3755 RepID=A0AAD4WLY0_PRUDU|nr:hypothetical protein L3X38_012533 [Prunus dulcis]
MVDHASIARCCIENGLFPTVLLCFQYPCSISDGWSEWVDCELKDLSTCDILCCAGMRDVIFLSKPCNILIEAEMLRHVVRRRGTETHTFICLRMRLAFSTSPFAATKILSTSHRLTRTDRSLRNESCRLATLISLWLGKFIFCDFSQDCLHEWVFPFGLGNSTWQRDSSSPHVLGTPIPLA